MVFISFDFVNTHKYTVRGAGARGKDAQGCFSERRDISFHSLLFSTQPPLFPNGNHAFPLRKGCFGKFPAVFLWDATAPCNIASIFGRNIAGDSFKVCVQLHYATLHE
jgi:hypothetical protein